MKIAFDTPSGCILSVLLVCLCIVFLPIVLFILLISLIVGTPVPVFGTRLRSMKHEDAAPDNGDVIDVEAEVVDEKSNGKNLR